MGGRDGGSPSDHPVGVRVQLPHVLRDPADARGSDAADRALRDDGILAVFHYLPLHLSEMGGRWGGRSGDCPVTESVSERLVRLPFYTSLSEEDQERVIEAVRAVR